MTEEVLFPPIEPFVTGMLDVGGGHFIYWEQSGNLDGIPVLFCHGGPGSSCTPAHRRLFDPDVYRIILFDQRGCGRSLPFGETRCNTTWDLIADMEKLRAQVAVDRWLLFGGSWGSALALAYGQNHRHSVLGFVLRGIFLATQDEMEWYLYGLRRFLPEAWGRLAMALNPREGEGLLEACDRRLAEGQPADALAAARAWCEYESAVIALDDRTPPGAAPSDAAALARAKVQVHYLRHHCFLGEQPILTRLLPILALPAIIVQGRQDMVCPPAIAATLASRWLLSELRMVEGAGHLAFNPALAKALVQALADFPSRLAVQP